jgi:hypothetical protein
MRPSDTTTTNNESNNSYNCNRDASEEEPSSPGTRPGPSSPSAEDVVEACYRKERVSADFRGTSMYASARVHQLRDYSPRDDVWSLLYVFCDLVSGGLPWMSHAANRDRQACQTLKERIHGLEASPPDGEILVSTHRLLMGDEYHVALFRKYQGGVDPPPGCVDDGDDPTLPSPMAISNDKRRVDLLTTAFEHLKGLQFTDRPDYGLIRTCLEGFLPDETSTGSGAGGGLSDARDGRSRSDDVAGTESQIPRIDWEQLQSDSFRRTNRLGNRDTEGLHYLDYEIPTWEVMDGDEVDPVNSTMLAQAERVAAAGGGGDGSDEDGAPPLVGEAADIARLPLEVRFRVAQMEYNTLNRATIEPHLALGDWMKVALFLVYGHWDAKRYEKGGHRADGDGYRREFYLRLVDRCLDSATQFRGFRQRACFYEADPSADTTLDPASGEGSSSAGQSTKKRRIESNIRGPKGRSNGVDMLAVAKVMFQLRRAKTVEEKLPRAPPPRLSFG